MASQQPQAKLSVRGEIHSIFPANLKFLKDRDWSGDVKGEYPPVIKPGEEAYLFKHEGIGPDGSKGAVVYYTPSPEPNPNPVMQTAFLVSWWRSVRYAKVHVLVGSKARFDHIKWEEVESELHKSGEESSHFDPFVRTSIAARIGYDGNLKVIFGSKTLPGDIGIPTPVEPDNDM